MPKLQRLRSSQQIEILSGIGRRKGDFHRKGTNVTMLPTPRAAVIHQDDLSQVSGRAPVDEAVHGPEDDAGGLVVEDGYDAD